MTLFVGWLWWSGFYMFKSFLAAWCRVDGFFTSWNREKSKAIETEWSYCSMFYCAIYHKFINYLGILQPSSWRKSPNSEISVIFTMACMPNRSIGQFPTRPCAQKSYKMSALVGKLSLGVPCRCSLKGGSSERRSVNVDSSLVQLREVMAWNTPYVASVTKKTVSWQTVPFWLAKLCIVT